MKGFVQARLGLVLDSWRKVFGEKLLRQICKSSNDYAASTGNTEFYISASELENFIAVMYIRGLLTTNLNVHFLWNRNFGVNFIKPAISRARFKTILEYLRFDDKRTRCERISTDKFTHIREIFELFRQNIKKVYNPEVSLTLDEQLLPYGGRSSLVGFVPNKPDKYGINFRALVEVQSKYVVDIISYMGQQEAEPRTCQLGEQVVKTLMEPLFGKDYNVTTDNFFTSLRVATFLQEKLFTICGTIRNNRRELSDEFTNNSQDQYSSRFFLSENNALLVSYQCKSNKKVNLLSTMHKSTSTDATRKQKPDVVHFTTIIKWALTV